MPTSGTRFALMTGLVPPTSVPVLPAYGKAVLRVIGTGGRKDAVPAVRHPGRWGLLWRDAEPAPEALPDAARRISAEAAA